MRTYYDDASQKEHIRRLAAIAKADPSCLTQREAKELSDAVETASNDALKSKMRDGDLNASDAYMQKHGLFSWLINH